MATPSRNMVHLDRGQRPHTTDCESQVCKDFTEFLFCRGVSAWVWTCTFTIPSLGTGPNCYWNSPEIWRFTKLLWQRWRPFHSEAMWPVLLGTCLGIVAEYTFLLGLPTIYSAGWYSTTGSWTVLVTTCEIPTSSYCSIQWYKLTWYQCSVTSCYSPGNQAFYSLFMSDTIK